jgi:hypothetical protein
VDADGFGQWRAASVMDLQLRSGCGEKGDPQILGQASGHYAIHSSVSCQFNAAVGRVLWGKLPYRSLDILSIFYRSDFLVLEWGFSIAIDRD